MNLYAAQLLLVTINTVLLIPECVWMEEKGNKLDFNIKFHLKKLESDLK